MQIECLGNRKLLESRKVTFLCSRTVSSGAVLRCYDWATKMAVSRSFITAAPGTSRRSHCYHQRFPKSGSKPFGGRRSYQSAYKG